MSTTIIAFFNNKGGVGKTSLVYHLAWMYRDMDLRVVAADLDPQANLTAAFLEEDRLEELWHEERSANTVFGSVGPSIAGTGDFAEPHLEYVQQHLSFDTDLALLVGDSLLSGLEEQLSSAWAKCLDGDEAAFRAISAFWRTLQSAAKTHESDVVLVDLGPNLGAINRAALIAADYVVVPLSADLFSLQGLRDLGPALGRWRKEWQARLKQNPVPGMELPLGKMEPVGYVVLQQLPRLDRPVRPIKEWYARTPLVYREAILKLPETKDISVLEDPNCLALVKNYPTMMPIAEEARKPMFHLKPADGALGAYRRAVVQVYRNYRELAEAIARKTGLEIPSTINN